MLAAICIYANISGCQSPAVTKRPLTLDDIPTLVQKGQYKTALDIAKSAEKPSTQTIQWIEKEANAATEQAITAAKRMALQNRWKEAIDHINTAIVQYPDSIALTSMKESLRRQEKTALRESDIRSLLQHARWLRTHLDSIELESQSTQSSWRTQYRAYRLNIKRETTFDSLAKHYRRLRHDHPLVPEVIYALQTIAQSEQERALVDTLKPINFARFTPQAKSSSPPRDANSARSPQQKLGPLFSKLNAQMDRGNLIKARETLSQIQDLKTPIPPTQKARLVAVESFLSEQASHLSSQADVLYKQGHFEQARTLWMLSARLNPLDSDILAKIARSERVLKNLEALGATESEAK